MKGNTVFAFSCSVHFNATAHFNCTYGYLLCFTLFSKLLITIYAFNSYMKKKSLSITSKRMKLNFFNFDALLKELCIFYYETFGNV